MGVEKAAVTVKMDIENVIFIDDLRMQVFIGVSRSGMANLIITWNRLASAAGDITLRPETVKKYLVPTVHQVHLPPQKVGRAEVKSRLA